MEFDALHRHLKMKPGATEEFPFDEDTMVFKVGGKMFALLAFRETPLRITLKCAPNEAKVLREMYAAVTAGNHMNKIICTVGKPPFLQISNAQDACRAA